MVIGSVRFAVRAESLCHFASSGFMINRRDAEIAEI
jgi:hypothetical protein